MIGEWVEGALVDGGYCRRGGMKRKQRRAAQRAGGKERRKGIGKKDRLVWGFEGW